MSCKYCEKYKRDSLTVEEWDVKTMDWLEILPNFCPMCAALLRDIEPLSLDELRVIGKPVYVVIGNISERWMLVRDWNSNEIQFMDSDGNRVRLVMDKLNEKWWAYTHELRNEGRDD